MQTAWFCEKDSFCRKVLAKHWPGVPCYEDVCGLAGATLSPVDVLVGGSPCQGFSDAGLGLGFDDPRSGLWSEFARLVGESRPRYVVLENVPGLLRRGFGRVLGDLAALGYDSEWDCIPASAVDAPHRRDRVWLVAYSGCDGGEPDRRSRELASAQGASEGHCEERERVWGASRRGGAVVADPERERPQRGAGIGEPSSRRPSSLVASVRESGRGQWKSEPDVGRVAHGVPARVDRLRSLGNALVPQIAEWIGRRILEWEGNHAAQSCPCR